MEGRREGVGGSKDKRTCPYSDTKGLRNGAVIQVEGRTTSAIFLKWL